MRGVSGAIQLDSSTLGVSPCYAFATNLWSRIWVFCRWSGRSRYTRHFHESTQELRDDSLRVSELELN